MDDHTSGLRVSASSRLWARDISQHDAKDGNVATRPLVYGNAFTLVELLVVIAILGILVSLITAGAQAARRRGA